MYALPLYHVVLCFAGAKPDQTRPDQISQANAATCFHSRPVADSVPLSAGRFQLRLALPQL